MFKIFNGLAPTYLVGRFKPINTVQNYYTRGHHLNYDIPKPNNDFLKNSPEYNGAVAWNNIPAIIRHLFCLIVLKIV